MARRKTLLKLPFLRFKINKQTIFNIFGFILLIIGFILLISFAKNFSENNEGALLFRLNSFLIKSFGFLSIFIPFILIFLSGHFFNTKKLKIIKPSISVGMIIIFISLSGLFGSGHYGKVILESLSNDFTRLGAVIFLTIVFFIGLVIFFETSIDVFLIFLFKFIKSSILFIKNYFFKKLFDKESRNSLKINQSKPLDIKKSDLIIKNYNEQLKKTKEIPVSIEKKIKSEISIKPIISSSKSTWVYPPLSLLTDSLQEEADRGDIKANATKIEETLDSFGIRAKVVEVNPGPTVTQYAIQIPLGTKLSKVTTLANNLALTLAAKTGQVRIEAPIPGKSLVGIEIPNIRPEIVTLKRLLSSSIFVDNNDPLLVPLGLDVSGQTMAASISKMPHVLIAGATGSGKSVLLNAWICAMLFRTKPEDLRLILVDPKRVELSLYNGIPHLASEVIIEANSIISALKWTVKEMEERYKAFAKVGARNIESYNSIEGLEKKPYIIFIIDELADLMIFAPNEAEELITRVAQMSRATGIHLVLATQRPSVDVITGLMKANIPTRVAFNVSSMIDSRVIIDMPGAEKLLGKGDMLYLPPDKAKPIRIQGPFISEKEVLSLVKFLKTQVPEVHYTEEILTQPVTVKSPGIGTISINGGDVDPLFNEALKIIIQHNKASTSLLQRRLSIGYSRAAKILDQLEAAGYVGPAEGSKPREVLKRPTDETIKDESTVEIS